MKELANELLSLTKAKILLNEPLSKYTTFRIGGPCDILIFPQDTKDLTTVLKTISSKNIPYFIMGNGSNLLVSDEGYRGAIIRIAGNMAQVSIKDTVIKAGAGIFMKKLIYMSAEEGLAGLEYFIGIPSSLGGAIAMNMGGLVTSISDVVKFVSVLKKDGKIKRLSGSECFFGYRQSAIKKEKDIIVEAEIQLKKDDPEKILDRADGLLKYKAMSQPVGMRSAGCIFKNPEDNELKLGKNIPPNASAGRLIEEAGLKGESIGGAVVSDIHANFIVNQGAGKAKDVISLIYRIKGIVFEKFNIELQLEVEMVG